MLENLVPAPRATRVQYPVPARGAALAALARICAQAHMYFQHHAHVFNIETSTFVFSVFSTSSASSSTESTWSLNIKRKHIVIGYWRWREHFFNKKYFIILEREGRFVVGILFAFVHSSV